MFEVITLGGQKTVSTKSACNHVYCVDISGSMYRDLPAIRSHLKNIIAVVAQPEDTVSIIWFSGRNQAGIVCENVAVSDLGTVSLIHAAIDRYIQAQGATGFVDPLNLAKNLTLTEGKANNLLFLTDGCDNSWSRKDILQAVSDITTKYQSVAFIEYGYYADREMLATMAQQANGLHLFADGYEKYEEVSTNVINGTPRVPMIEVKVNKTSTHAVYVYGGNIRIVEAVDGKVSVPEDTDTVYAINSRADFESMPEDKLYLVFYFALKTSNHQLAMKALSALGDVALINAYENAFTKQELSTVEDLTSAAVLDESKRFLEGQDLMAVPDKNARTVINVLQSLAGAGATLQLNSPHWSYNRIGKGKQEVEATVLPRFIPSPMDQVSLRALVFNSERPNVSIGTTLKGTVELPENEFGLKFVGSMIHRNYAIIKDGTKNVITLPVTIPNDKLDCLIGVNHTIVSQHPTMTSVLVDLSKTPVINRSKVERVSLDSYVRVVADLELAKVDLKVIKGLLAEREVASSKIAGLTELYGAEAADWLSSIGVRDYGFGAVGTKSAEATDEYQAITVDYSIKGLSSLPSMTDARKKSAEAKEKNKTPVIGVGLMSQAIAVHQGKSDEELKSLFDSMTEYKRGLEVILADMHYTLILGRVWFSDEEVVKKELTLGSYPTTLTVSKERKTIKL